jgi:predicted metal-dependent hydrolase
MQPDEVWISTTMAQHLEGDWLELATTGGSIIRVLKAAHPRARRLRLTVTSKGARVSYPNGTHPAQVSAFLRVHADWLEKKLDELNLVDKPLPPLRLGYPCTFPLRGELVQLDWAEGIYPKIEAQAGSLTLVIPRPHTRALLIARGLLAAHLESLIRRDVSRWLAGYVPQLGLAPTSLRIRPMTSLWGSLDTRDRINLDLALALAPPAALRYVLVHELCHLKVRNHSPRFWNQVEHLLPGWREQRDWLRQHGAILKSELDRLVGDVAD